MTAPLVIILSSPSGGGKSAIARALVASRDDMGYAISATTRGPRPDERHGVDYYFLTPEEFDARVAAGDFAEWAVYGGARYGTLETELQQLKAEGRHAVLDLEVRGARALRSARTDTVTIFILPPDGPTLLERLRRRGTEDPAALRQRLGIALEELQAAPEYDYIVVNDVLERVVEEVLVLVEAEGRRPARVPHLSQHLEALTRAVREAATA